ncbi:TonB-dependent receptor [Persicobacter diffluens]|uniref:SusC/RagA family TonB-linked outer membrane protein n=1 Tax=Persicobacter diffluens TaxID=981 RepID=A0AAN4W518_9BACT|nr:SusC/RagA family TonB-linked outer membrane protein [Persicobacter diffluens]
MKIVTNFLSKGWKKTALLAVVFQLFCLMPTLAQSLIKGKVISATDQEGFPGVNITLKSNPSIGVVTDVEGHYSIKASKNEVLIFSFVGFTTEEVAVGNQTTIDVALNPEVTELEELVVIGYGSVKKSDMTGSVSQLKATDIQKAPSPSPAAAISGRIPGVNVTTTDGSPDAEIVIRVRGGGSVTQDNTPLYVVDGFIVESINNIPPSDITSINVLKDAAATSIYGAQAANGVVVITTKEPKAGSTEVSYNGFVQVKQLPKERKYSVLDPYEYVLANYELNRLRSQDDVDRFAKFYGNYEDLELYQHKPATDWQDELFGQTRISQFHNLSISGGGETTKAMLSLTHNDDQGILKNNGFQRTVINFKLNQNIGKKLRLDAGARISNSVVDGAGTSGGAQLRVKDGIATRPVNGITDDMDLDMNDLDGNDDFQSFLLSMVDPRDLVEDDWRQRNDQEYVFNVGLNWKILDNLVYNTTFTSQTRYRESLRFYGPLTSRSRQEGNSLPLGEMTNSNRDSYRWLNTLTYNFNLGNKNNLDIMAGHEIYSNGSYQTYMRALNFRESITPEEMFSNMQLGVVDRHSSYLDTRENRLSYFGRANFSHNNKYLLTATLRSDMSSKFSGDNRVGLFPAVAAGWKLSEENFLRGFKKIDELKLRVSAGTTGNDRIPANSTKFLFKSSNDKGPGMGTNGYNPYFTPDGDVLYNPDLRWETTINRNIGLDFAFFGSRIYGNVDAYWNTTNDLLLQSRIPEVSGFKYQWNNVGSTSNRGIEFQIDGYVVEKENFTVKLNANAGFNRSRIDALDGVDERFFQSNWSSTNLMHIDDYYLNVGGSIGQMYGFVSDGMYTTDDFEGYDATNDTYILKDGVPDASGILGVDNVKPGYLKLKETNRENKDEADQGKIDDSDRTVIGNALPKVIGGFGVDVSYKGFDFSTFFNFSYGNDVYNTGKIEFNQMYRTNNGNMLDNMRMDNRYTYLDVDGSYTGVAGGIITDMDQLDQLNQGKQMWSHTSFGQSRTVFHDWAVEDGSFLRLSQMTVGYTLPQTLTQKVGISNCRFYLTGYNLWLWTSYSGYDPEVSTTRSNSYGALTPGIDYSAFPRSRSYTLGVNLTF